MLLLRHLLQHLRLLIKVEARVDLVQTERRLHGGNRANHSEAGQCGFNTRRGLVDEVGNTNIDHFPD